MASNEDQRENAQTLHGRMVLHAGLAFCATWYAAHALAPRPFELPMKVKRSICTASYSTEDRESASTPSSDLPRRVPVAIRPFLRHSEASERILLS
ncbi:hypothetical protein BST61_g5447 [Cercospora zeina]